MPSMRAIRVPSRVPKTRLHDPETKDQWRHIQRRVTTRPESAARNELAWKEDRKHSGGHVFTIITKHMREKQRVPTQPCDLQNVMAAVVVVKRLEGLCSDNAMKTVWVSDQTGHNETIAMRVSQSCKKYGHVLERLLHVSPEHSSTRQATKAHHTRRVHRHLHF